MQDRWVSYIYRYKDEKRWENAGYIKAMRTSREGIEEVRLDLGVKLFKPFMCRCRIYMIYDGKELLLLEELLVPPEEKEEIRLKKTYSWRDFLRAGLTPWDYDGLLFAVDDGDTLMSLWKDKEIKLSQLSVLNKSVEVVVEEITEKAVEKIDEKVAKIITEKEAGETFEELVDKVTKRPELNPVDQLMSESVRLPIFIDSPFLQCVKIEPQDIGRLPMSNWKLGQNSFLTHGYYRYRYIMLGKIKLAGRESNVIGVPGVYTNKEKYLANMFGFSLFVPVKKSDTKMGSFGYWVWEVTKQ